jgi:glycine hydroxymethyltransferase
MLFPHRVAEIAAHGIPILYDASHVAGLIAGGRFQDPLGEGAAAVTFSTYKSYGGPPGGAIATNDPLVAERVFAAVYPGLTANFDAGRLRGLGIAAAELLKNGAGYSARCIEAAQALGQALSDAGLVVAGGERGFTQSHHLAVLRPDAPSAVGLLERAGIYVSATQLGSDAALRLGTQELVRRGFGPEDMVEVAQLFARALADREPPAHVLPAVTRLRRRASRIFVRTCE